MILFDSITAPNRTNFPFTKVVCPSQQFITSNASPNVVGLKNYCDQAEQNNALLCLDIETWPINHSLIQSCLQICRSYKPHIRLSYFGSGAVNGTIIQQGISGVVSAWIGAYTMDTSLNQYKTISMMDYIASGLYLSSNQTVEQFNAMAGYTIASSLKYNKPIYAFINPFYGDTGIEIPAKDWITILWSLNTTGLDGMIVWSVLNTWNENADWWIELQNFNKQIGN